jgi:hypothetical protein
LCPTGASIQSEFLIAPERGKQTLQSIKLFAPCGTLKAQREQYNSPFLKNNGVLTIDLHHRWILIFIPDFKLENVLVSLHSLKTMGLGSIIFKEWRVTRTFSYT